MNKIYYYIRNQYVESTNAIVPFNDAGFLYGDGLFETMRFDNRKVFSIGDHLNRLFIGLKQINLLIKIQKKDIKNLIYKLIDMNSLDSGIIRVMITRGVVEKFDKSHGKPSLYISIKSSHIFGRIIALGFGSNLFIYVIMNFKGKIILSLA